MCQYGEDRGQGEMEKL
jgi:hypothetical protein